MFGGHALLAEPVWLALKQDLVCFEVRGAYPGRRGRVSWAFLPGRPALPHRSAPTLVRVWRTHRRRWLYNVYCASECLQLGTRHLGDARAVEGGDVRLVSLLAPNCFPSAAPLRRRLATGLSSSGAAWTRAPFAADCGGPGSWCRGAAGRVSGAVGGELLYTLAQ